MFKTQLFLAALGLILANVAGLKAPHPDCPTDRTHHLLPHEYDCSKFYYCEEGEKFIEPRDCPSGLEFSPVEQVCIWPVQANCTLPGSPTTTSAPTTTTTTAATTTTTAAPTTTTAATTTTTAATTTTTAATTTTTAATTTTTAASTTTTAPSTTPAPGDNRCQTECNVLPWAHEDCDKFWICNGENAVLIACSEGLLFNPILGACDFACNTNCVRRTVQSTAQEDGLRVFLPWDQIDDETRAVLKRITN